MQAFFQNLSQWFSRNIALPVARSAMILRDGALWQQIGAQFRYNTWGEVVNRIYDSLSNLIAIIAIIVFIVLLVNDAGFIGSLLGTALLIVVLVAVLATVVWVWENLLSSIVPLVLAILGGIGLIIGAFVSIRNYIRAFQTFCNAWKDYKDNGRFVEENAARRSYFFGPGQRQVANIFRNAWKRNFSSVGKIVSNRINVRHGIALRVLLAPFVWAYLLFYILSVMIFGSVLTFLIGLAHFAVILAVSLVIWIVFTIVWLADRFYLMTKRITSICPHCKKNYRIPEFACPDCGRRQHNLIPSSYGVFRRKCACGKKLPTTFFNGRSRLEAYCPSCGEALVSSDSRQLGLTMVGASSAGKTALITSFFHQIRESTLDSAKAFCEVPTAHARKFERLNRYYNGMESLQGSVVGETTEMYSLLFHLRKGSGKVQFSLYDVAGEVFDTPDLNAIVYANDMAISQGIIFVLDPLSAPQLKEQARKSDHAAVREMSAVLNHFVTFLQTLSAAEKVGQRIKRPLAVVMNKMDSPAVSPWFDLRGLKAAMEMLPLEQRMSMQDQTCRDFLLQIGLSDFIMAVDAQFSNVHFFPVSATGGVERGMVFQPEAGMMDPFYWIMRQKDPDLADALGAPVNWG